MEIKRAALYVDGFNLYHAINDLTKVTPAKGYLKWLNLWRLGERIIPQKSQTLVKVAYCSAYNNWKFDSLTRHQKYVAALEVVGVQCIMGHFVKEDAHCNSCQATWKAPTEKQTDINLALTLIDDGMCDVYDHAYLLTADSDQVATVGMFRSKFGVSKLITTISPVGRPHSKHIFKNADFKIALNESHLDESVFPLMVQSAGAKSVIRPAEYAPPAGWVHPDDRP